MQFKFSDKEQELYEEFCNSCRKVLEWKGLEEEPTFVIEIVQSAVGNTVYMCCEQLEAKSDITDYNSW